MSAFWAICPACGERYFHLFVGGELLAGHRCPSPANPAEWPPVDPALYEAQMRSWKNLPD